MNLPKSGRVVIIDDKFEEALPLIHILSKDRVAVTFFSGRIEELPPEPFRDVRVVFLDVVLEEVQGQDNKTIVSKLIGVTRKIVSRENGPFILVIWTKHPELIKGLQKTLKEEGFYILIVDLEKHKFFEWKDGKWLFSEDKIEELHKEIEDKVNRIDIFRVFVDWENLAHDAASITVNEVSKLAEYNDQWNREIKKIFYNLAKAWAGKNIENMENKERIKSALYVFHQVFADIFERKLQDKELKDIVLEEGDISDETKGKINSRIILAAEEREIYPGNVYEDEPMEREFIKGILNENIEDRLNSIIQNSIPVFVDVTPVCDFVQQKIRMSRMVKGALIPGSINSDENIWKKIKKNAAFIYVSPVIHYKGENYKMVLDFRYFTSREPDKLDSGKILFRIRKEMLSDIQIRLSSHVNRVGVLFIE